MIGTKTGIEALPDNCLVEIEHLWLMSKRQDWNKLVAAQYVETSNLGALKAMSAFSRAFGFDEAGEELAFLESLLMTRNGLLFEESYNQLELENA